MHLLGPRLSPLWEFHVTTGHIRSSLARTQGAAAAERSVCPSEATSREGVTQISSACKEFEYGGHEIVETANRSRNNAKPWKHFGKLNKQERKRESCIAITTHPTADVVLERHVHFALICSLNFESFEDAIVMERLGRKATEVTENRVFLYVVWTKKFRKFLEATSEAANETLLKDVAFMWYVVSGGLGCRAVFLWFSGVCWCCGAHRPKADDFKGKLFREIRTFGIYNIGLRWVAFRWVDWKFLLSRAKSIAMRRWVAIPTSSTRTCHQC